MKRKFICLYMLLHYLEQRTGLKEVNNFLLGKIRLKLFRFRQWNGHITQISRDFYP